MLRSGSIYADGDGVADKKGDGGRFSVIDSGISPYISLVAYCKSDGHRLDARRFFSIGLHGELLKLCSCNGIRRDTAVVSCIRALKRRVVMMPLSAKMSSSETDMSYVRNFEDAL